MRFDTTKYIATLVAVGVWGYFFKWSSQDYLIGFCAATAFFVVEGLAWILSDILNEVREIKSKLRGS